MEKPAEMSAPVECLVMWRADTTLWKAVEVECHNGLLPYLDCDGKAIFDTTHFQTQEEAEKRLRSEAKAGLQITASRLECARDDVLALEKETGDWAIIWNGLIDS